MAFDVSLKDKSSAVSDLRTQLNEQKRTYEGQLAQLQQQMKSVEDLVAGKDAELGQVRSVHQVSSTP